MVKKSLFPPNHPKVCRKACETVLYMYIKLDDPRKIFEAVFFSFFSVTQGVRVGGFLPTL